MRPKIPTLPESDTGVRDARALPKQERRTQTVKERSRFLAGDALLYHDLGTESRGLSPAEAMLADLRMLSDTQAPHPKQCFAISSLYHVMQAYASYYEIESDPFPEEEAKLGALTCAHDLLSCFSVILHVLLWENRPLRLTARCEGLECRILLCLSGEYDRQGERGIGEETVSLLTRILEDAGAAPILLREGCETQIGLAIRGTLTDRLKFFARDAESIRKLVLATARYRG